MLSHTKQTLKIGLKQTAKQQKLVEKVQCLSNKESVMKKVSKNDAIFQILKGSFVGSKNLQGAFSTD